MILGDFITIIRAYVPAAKSAVITDSLLTTLINMGVDDVNANILAYHGDKKFDVDADNRDYVFSSVASDFLSMDEGGLWFNRGTVASPDYARLDPYTRKSLDQNFPKWKDNGSNTPLRYIVDVDQVKVDPPPASDLTNGFWLFYIKKAARMTATTNYPFTNTTTEIAALSVLDDAIIDYVRWKLALPLKNDENQQGLIAEKEYRQTLAEKAELLRRRLDITASPFNRMRGVTIG